MVSHLTTSDVMAAKYYRYLNKEGKVVVSSTLPPEVSQDGYEIVNEMGVVIETISPRKTEEQILEELAKQARLKEEERRRLEQQQLDTILVNSYTDISDIERARDRELSARDRDIMLLKQNIRRLTRLLEDTQTRAARDERLGRKVSQEILDEVVSFKKRIAAEQKEVLEVEEHKQRISERYASSIIRFNEIKAAEQLRRHQPGALDKEQSKTVIYQCADVQSCDKAWQSALLYASEYSTTELAWANETTIMMRKPVEDTDISILLTRVNNRNGKDSSLVLEVRCSKTIKGQELCESETVQSIRDGFIPYLN